MNLQTTVVLLFESSSAELRSNEDLKGPECSNYYLKERNYCMNLFLWVIFFFNISHGFNYVNWLPMDFSQRFTFVNVSFISVLYVLIFLWFLLQLVVWESRNSYPNFLIFQIAWFGYNRLNSWLFDIL